MARRVFTKIVFALGLLCFFAFAGKAQQVTFAISPSTLSPTPAVGDTVSLLVTVKNFTNIFSFQYGIEWDPLLFTYVSTDNVGIADPSNFGSNPYGGNTVIYGWNSASTGKSMTNGQTLFRLKLKVKATSTNYWAKFSSASTPIEVIQYPATALTPAFSNLGNPPGSTPTPVTVQATAAQTVASQSKVCVDVTTTNFTSLTSAQWVTKWNPAILRFDSISVMNNTVGLTASNFNSTQASGRLALNWAAATNASKTVAAGSVLYRVCYTAIGANGTNSAITFDSAQIFQAASGSSVAVAMNNVNSSVNVNVTQPSTGLVFTAPNLVVKQNDTVCVDIKAGSFTNIALMTYAMQFDSTKMTLLSAKLGNATLGIDGIPSASGTMTSNSFNNSPSGTLRFIWTSNTGLGVTLPDSSVIINMCFKYTAGAGTSSYLRFGAQGSRISVKDGNLENVPYTFKAGNISVAGAITTPITLTPTVKNVTCAAGTDGGVTLAVSGGTGSYTYAWSNGATTKDLTNVAAGTYNVTITSGSVTKTDTYTITAPTAFLVTNQVVNVNCFGQSTGSVTLSVTGATPQYTYAWSNGATSQNLANVPAGSYTVTVTDSKGCKTTPAAIAVTQPTAAITATVNSKTNPTCNGGSDGAISLNVSGGTANYTFNWTGSNGYTSTNQNLTGLKADTYNLTITDSKGCTLTRQDVITEPSGMTIGAETVTNSRCGQRVGAIAIAGVTGGNGGYTYTWTGSNYTASTQNITNLAAGQYSLTVKDSKQCSVTKVYTVADAASTVAIGSPTITGIKCYGGSDGAIAVSASGGTGALTYSWTGPNGFVSAATALTGLNVGTYSLAVTDASGCAKSASYDIIQPASAVAINPSVTNIRCKGTASGAISLNAAGGTAPFSYAWTGVTSTSASVSSLKAGAYAATVTDANGCTKNQSFTITEPTDSLKVLTANITKGSCAGTATGAITTTIGGGAQPYQFNWSGPSGFNTTSQNITSLNAGTYSLTVTDANQCSFTASYNVDAASSVVVSGNVTDAVQTPNGAITLTVSGGTPSYTYSWSGQGVNATSKDQSGLCPGTYTVTVTDAASCPTIKSFTVGGQCSASLALSVSATPAGCPGQNIGRLELTIGGGLAPYTYIWKNTAGDVVGRDKILSNLVAGDYNVTVTDAGGQSRTATYTIAGSQTAIKVTGIAISPETCTGSDASIALTVSGGAPAYTYKWSDLGNVSAPKDRLSIRSGTYSVTISDANGCLKDTGNIVVAHTPCQLVTVTTKKDAKCYGDNNGSITVNIQNGEPGYKIKWSANDSASVNNLPLHNGSYEITGLRAGTYTITITDARGQSKVETQTVSSPTQIIIEKAITSASNGCNGAIVLTVSGGQGPYVYNWNTGATSRDLFALCCDTTKKYSVTISDASGCIASTGNDVVPCAISPLTVDAIVSNPICRADSTSGRIEVKPAGGVGPYSYVWTTANGTSVGGNSAILSGIAPGKYLVTVTDSRSPVGQKWSGNYSIAVTSTLKLANLTLVASDDDITANGQATLDIQGGAPDFNIAWCNGTTGTATDAARTVSAKNLSSGLCNVIITDRQGCREKIDFVVPSKTCATIEIQSQVKCFGAQNGSARISRVSPDLALPVSYRWSTGETSIAAFKLKAGENSVTITDANGKTCVNRTVITSPAQLVAGINVDLKTKTATASVTGGVPPYSYRWIPSNDTSAKTSLSKSGTIYLFALDQNGCNDSKDTTIYVDLECLVGSAILSPNDDSRNESFTINACDFKNVRLEVYNRWGELVYARDNYTNGIWQGNDQDGTAGKQLPDGVYMYVMKAQNSLGEPFVGKGTVTIVRQ